MIVIFHININIIRIIMLLLLSNLGVSSECLSMAERSIKDVHPVVAAGA